jgi:nucleoside-diphosphate-sugar epimerase
MQKRQKGDRDMNILVCGASGFIGGHMVEYLKERGHAVVAADIRDSKYGIDKIADKFYVMDLRLCDSWGLLYEHGPFDEIYQLAADMGGAGYIFSGEHDASIMRNSCQINLNALERECGKIFFSSSACIYPAYNQMNEDDPVCVEATAYPAMPDSEYGYEKLFSERLYMTHARQYKREVRIARFHNIFGPEGSWNDGKEKAPAAICRKVAMAKDGEAIEIWGDGKQSRSFLYIEECLDGVRRLMDSNYGKPLNIGSEEMISIDGLAQMAMDIAGKKLSIMHKSVKTIGVRGRCSDNLLCEKILNWKPSKPLRYGMERLYAWVSSQL